MWGRLGMTLMLSSTSRTSCLSPCSFNGNMSRRKITPLTMTMAGACNSWSQLLFVATKTTRGGSGGKTSPVIREPLHVYLPGDEIPTPRHRRSKFKEIPIKSDEIVPSEKDQYSPFNPANIFDDVMTEAKNFSKRKLIVLEGQRLVEEGFKAGLKLNRLFFQKTIAEVPARLQPYIEKQKVPILYVAASVIRNWSTLMTPPGIVGVFYKPKLDEVGKRTNLATGIPVTVICDNIREPGNLGSILRSAAGVGCKRVLLSKGCVDPWDPKVLRAGCGAQFYVPIIMNYPLHSLVNSMEIEDEADLKMEKEKAGGGRSVSGGDRARRDGSRKDRELEKSDEVTTDSAGDSETESKSGREDENDDSMSHEKPRSSFALFLADSHNSGETDDERKSVPIVSYTDVDYKEFRNVYLVVGGETEGLSRDILQITASLQNIHPSLLKTTAARLRIPLHNNVESLNASHAFAIISYEILRQYQLTTTSTSQTN